MSKQHVKELINQAVTQLKNEEFLLIKESPDFYIEATKDKKHGDLACNVAMMLAKPAKRRPRELAELIVKKLPLSENIQKVEIAGPGFINFFLSNGALYSAVTEIINEGENYGKSDFGKGKKVLLEFVSANPNGPLHVGHGRHAAYGAVVGDLLDSQGFNVTREYYLNDAGRQMDIITTSVWLRYLELCGEEIVFPVNAYKGEYVIEIAHKLFEKNSKDFYKQAKDVFVNLPKDESDGGDKEIYIDALIARNKELLGDSDYEKIFTLVLAVIQKIIHDDLQIFGVNYESWFSEKKFVSNDVVDRLLNDLTSKGRTYTKEGALWFRSTDFGDEKDRVLVRSNGVKTYFANDLAYHINKFERGFDLVIDIFGSDHHGYVPRMQAGLEAFGIDNSKMIFLLGQFVTLYRGGEQVQMSTRSGSFVTLSELLDEVGKDAARFFYVMRKSEQHIDFDLDLAKSKSNENPVYYIQYAHARICSVLNQAKDKSLTFDQDIAFNNLHLLTEKEEFKLIGTIGRYKDLLLKAAINYEPHALTNYLRDLATDFHSYYNNQQFLVDDPALRNARLALIFAARQIIANGLKLVGVGAPEKM